METNHRHILIYTTVNSARLRYILFWIFEEQLQLSFEITSDLLKWNNDKGFKINYSDEKMGAEILTIKPHPIMAQTGVQTQVYNINRWKHSTILFYNQPGAAIPFDIFSATFFLLSRYEEYLPHQKDQHGRFEADQSLAQQFSFLQQPVVDEWLFHFRKILERKLNCTLPQPSFTFLPSYDIDIAWKYLHKGNKRNLGGYAKDLLQLKWKSVAERAAVLAGKKTDPFDNFDFLDKLHARYQLQPIYFMLLGQWSDYDKNAEPNAPAMSTLMQQLAQRYEMGIHPSYLSHQSTATLKSEIEILAKASHKPVTNSRQHYIKFTLPETYRNLIEANIKDDFSMGYASCNGFRAGTSRSFLWYDVLREATSTLRVHPFVYMEATSMFYQKNSVQEAFLEWERLYYAVKNVQGTFISIWHNHNLGEDRKSKKWRALYEKMLATIAEDK